MYMASNRKHTDPAIWIAAIAMERDRAAFASLFDFYAPRIKGFLMRTGSAAEVAEEIAQETMLLVWRKAALFNASRARASTWIYTIARNLRVDWLRHERTVSAAMIYDVVEQDAPAQPDDEVAGAQRDETVRAAMQALPSEQMAVIQLSFFEDKAHGDIARILGIPLGTVKSRLRLAMEKLRERLEDQS
jgi:RNA polymerase sigma-70 factor (ECF subfamily)